MVQGTLCWSEGNKQTPSTVPPRCAWYMPLTRTRLLIYNVWRVDWDGEGVRVRLLFSSSDANQPPSLSTTFPVYYLHLSRPLDTFRKLRLNIYIYIHKTEKSLMHFEDTFGTFPNICADKRGGKLPMPHIT